jgi:hypothetical protein
VLFGASAIAVSLFESADEKASRWARAQRVAATRATRSPVKARLARARADLAGASR